MKALIKPVAAVLLASVIAACSLIPTPTQPPRQDLQAPVMTAADTGLTPPQKVTFPSMVKTTPLAAPETPELDAVSALLQAFQAENGSFTTASETGKEPKATPSPQREEHEDHEAWVVELKSKEAKGKRQIRIPETGEFKLVLEAGPRFEIIDRDARDGEAKIQMPAATLKTWIHLEEAKDNSSLEVSDELYYVKDTLSKERQQKHHDDERAKQWFKLGLRPMPVPSDWYSPDGQAFVLRFKANQIKEFQMIWQKQRGEAPFPPGIKSIGPEGGVVELPGVGKIEIPEGGLLKKTTVKLAQEKEVLVNIFPQEKVIAPPLRIEPFGLKLAGNKSGVIELETDVNQFEPGHSASSVYYLDLHPAPGLSNSSHLQLARLIDPNPEGEFRLRYLDPGAFDTFSTFVLVAEADVLKNFSISAAGSDIAGPCNPIYYTATLGQVFVDCENISTEKRDLIEIAAEKAFSEYTSIQPNPLPLGGFRLKDRADNVYYLTHVFFKSFDPRTYTADAITYRVLTQRANSYGIFMKPSEVEKPGSFVIDRVCHEMYHAFQAQHNPQQFESAFSDLRSSWLLESNARFMGTQTYYNHHAYFLQNFPQQVDTDKIKSIYSDTIPYGLSFDNGQKNTFRPYSARSLYQFPPLVAVDNYLSEELKYTYVNLSALTAKRYGLKRIIDIDKEFLKPGIFTLEQSMDAFFKLGNYSTYKNIVLSAALKNYGLGTESRANIESIEKDNYLYFTPSYDPVLLLSSTNRLSNFEGILDNLSSKILVTHGTAVPHPLDDERSMEITLIRALKHKDGEILSDYKSVGQEITQNTLVSALSKDSFHTSKPELIDTKLFEYDKSKNKYKTVIKLPKLFNQQIMLLSTNPNIRSSNGKNSIKYDFSYTLKLSPIITATRPLDQGEDPTQTRFAATVKDADCTVFPCTMFIETQGGNLSEVPVEEVINVVRDQENQIISQEVVVTANNHAIVGGSIHLDEDGLSSNTLEDAVYVCNMLKTQLSGGICVSSDSFCLAAENKVKQKLLPCTATK